MNINVTAKTLVVVRDIIILVSLELSTAKMRAARPKPCKPVAQYILLLDSMSFSRGQLILRCSGEYP